MNTARRFVIDTLAAWQSAHDPDTVVLLVGELVTNAVVHARTDSVVTLRCEGAVLTVEVRDASDQPAARRLGVAVTDIGGRGLNLVVDLSDGWGVRKLPDGGRSFGSPS